MENKEKLTNFVSEIIRSSTGDLLGSFIGQRIASEFPQLDIKQEFGGLRPFIQQHCPHILNFIDKHGSDDLYRPDPSLPRASSELRALNRGKKHTPVSLWKIFSNPASGSFLAVDLEGLTIFRTSVEVADSANIRALKPITLEEQNTLIRRFADAHIQETERATYLAAIEKNTDPSAIWNTWSTLLHSIGKTKYLHSWITFRKEELESILSARVSSFGISDTDIDTIISQLSNDSDVDPATSAKHKEVTSKDEIEEILDYFRGLPMDDLRALVLYSAKRLASRAK